MRNAQAGILMYSVPRASRAPPPICAPANRCGSPQPLRTTCGGFTKSTAPNYLRSSLQGPCAPPPRPVARRTGASSPDRRPGTPATALPAAWPPPRPRAHRLYTLCLSAYRTRTVSADGSSSTFGGADDDFIVSAAATTPTAANTPAAIPPLCFIRRCTIQSRRTISSTEHPSGPLS